jgi:hypothetical protein
MKMRVRTVVALLVLPMLLVAGNRARAEIPAPDPSFEEGAGAAPAGWTLEGGGRWTSGIAHSGKRAIEAAGNGKESSFWRADLNLKPDTAYAISFWARGRTRAGGCIISGPEYANQDCPVVDTWTRYESFFRTPSADSHYLRFGQWMVDGEVYFDDIAIREVTPLHTRCEGAVLGDGESIRDGRYESAPISGDGRGSYSRNLADFTAAWNTNRWRMGQDNFIVYRHDLSDVPQRSAQVTVGLAFHQSGVCAVEASNDGVTYVKVGEVGVEGKTLSLPAGLFPARAIWVRLTATRATERSGDSAPGSFQITDYRYSAELNREVPDATGRTMYLQETRKADDLVVAVESIGDMRPAPGNRVRLAIETTRPREVTVSLAVGDSRTEKKARLRAGRSMVTLPYAVEKAGEYPVVLTVADERSEPLYEARTEVSVPILLAADYGELLSSGKLPVWWCGATYKVSAERPLPRRKGAAIRIAAARNEYEPFQVVVRGERGLTGVSVTASELVGRDGARIAPPEIRLVGYVNVAHPTDNLGMAGMWPDPLPRYTGPFDVPAGRNQPLWLTVYVPSDAPPGLYRGTVAVAAGGETVEAPVELRVWRFTLPQEPTIRSGFGFSAERVAQYENVSGDALQSTLDRYYRAFQSHRISPYCPMGGPEVEVADGTVTLDWTEFDRSAHYYLDELRFNSFRMPVQGLGGGTFHESAAAEFGGTKAGTPEYKQLMAQYLGSIQQHLEQKGWLDKAYIYWFDEPSDKQYEYVRGGMESLKEFAPKLNRFLTVRPVEPLYGWVNTWCVPVGAYDPKTCQERQQAGEEIWWYLCCGPHAPWVGLFIDHPAVDFRAWLWMSYKYGVTGVLIWQTNWWTSPTAFPDPELQNPYEDPMSYVSGYGVPVGTKQFWGNGDGRLWYPTNRHVGADKTPYTDGPVPSIRAELLREGIEDYEYFQLLQGLAGKPGAPAEAKALLEIPPEVITDLTHYNFDPEPMMRHRRKVAEMIERLGG